MRWTVNTPLVVFAFSVMTSSYFFSSPGLGSFLASLSFLSSFFSSLAFVLVLGSGSFLGSSWARPCQAVTNTASTKATATSGVCFLTCVIGSPGEWFLVVEDRDSERFRFDPIFGLRLPGLRLAFARPILDFRCER